MFFCQSVAQEKKKWRPISIGLIHNVIVDIKVLVNLQITTDYGNGYKSKHTRPRQYGLITSKKMLTNGLGGLFIMISGSTTLINSETFNEYAELPEGLSCKGTIVICRMPFNNKDFNYINYVE